jgi:RimJ/RimL family protein N-acetyltransferase
MILAKKVHKEEWAAHFSVHAHAAVFGTIKPASFDRIDYAWIAINTSNNDPVGYVTVRETDHETVYWAYGGGFQWARNSVLTGRAYKCLLEAQKASGTKRILTYIEPSNVAMLRLAMANGFRICGYRARGTISLVDLVLEFTDGDDEKLREHDQRKAGDPTAKL